MVYIHPSLAFPAVQLPSRERLQQWWERFITITLWAIAVTHTAGRLTRIGFEWARPYLAKALHALAIALDGGLLYPDQPEPSPVFDSLTALRMLRPDLAPPAEEVSAPAPAPVKPRPARRRPRGTAAVQQAPTRRAPAMSLTSVTDQPG